MLDGDDRYWMGQALALGATSEGATSPNPRVGCLLVREGEVVGRGCHRAPGQPHAETLALAEAGERANGASCYVNLEPCAHHGRTPPCTDQLLRSGVRRVVASLQDPDPRVNGCGFEQLRRGGVEVEVGLLAEQAERLNGPFLAWHRRGLPLVTLKAASSLDGMLSAAAGESRWISGAPARRFAHRLRWRHDAVLVGAATVRRDDPRLTVRLGEQNGLPRRIVLSASLELDPQAAIFSSDAAADRPVTVYTTNTDPAIAAELERRAEIKRLPGEHGALDLERVLRDLAHDGVQSVLVEGGGKTLGGFLRAGLAQRVAIFTSGKLLGARGGTPMIDLPVVEHPDRGWRIEREQLIPLGDDLVWMGSIRHGEGREGRHERVHRSG